MTNRRCMSPGNLRRNVKKRIVVGCATASKKNMAISNPLQLFFRTTPRKV
jgi:hypothetical protein